MAQGQHSSIRVALAVPPKLHEQLKAWADYEGRPVASLCMYLIEHSLRAAQRDGIAPSFGNEDEDDRIGVWQGYKFDTSKSDKKVELVAKKVEEEAKKDKLFALLKELTES